MKLETVVDLDYALTQIKSWLQIGEFSEETYNEIEDVIVAVEDYMGIPLPAKSFIESNCK